MADLRFTMRYSNKLDLKKTVLMAFSHNKLKLKICYILKILQNTIYITADFAGKTYK